MKLKYKKIILLTSLSTMGIGLLTLSISHGKLKEDEPVNPASRIVADSHGDDISTMSALDEVPEGAEVAAISPMPTTAPTPIPSPTPIPVYPLEEVEGISAFIDEYYIAKATGDVDKLKSIYLDPTKVHTREQLQNMVQYIEEYKNIETYAKKSIEDGAYIVYSYHEIKFSGINTLAPGLSKFYVVTDEDGNYKIASDMDPDIDEYFNARNGDQDVLELIQSTNLKEEEAKANDEDLMIFWNGLDELVKNNDSQSD